MTERVRVLVVDDSPFARKVLRETLARSPEIEVIGHATDGLDALEKIVEHKPDVVTMDLLMPGMDGVGVLRTLRDMPGRPRVIVVTTEDSDTKLAIAALQEGAFDIVVKPSKIASDRLYEIGRALVDTVLGAKQAAKRANGGAERVSLPEPARPTSATRLVVIGASTGGPRAVTSVLQALPASFPVPIAVVVHMPEGFTASFAERLDSELPFRVKEASDGDALVAGEVVIARAGRHLVVTSRDGGAGLTVCPDPVGALHRPSVDVLFASAASAFGRHVVGVVLTGMGNDGLDGCRKLREAGATVYVESEETAVVYGMPRVVAEAELASGIFTIEQMGRALTHYCTPLDLT